MTKSRSKQSGTAFLFNNKHRKSNNENRDYFFKIIKTLLTARSP